MPYRFILVCLICLPTLSFGQKSKSALFLGNSYTYVNDMPNLIRQIAISKGNTFDYKQHTPGGARFRTHINDTLTWRPLLENNSFDYLIMQGQSAELSGNSQNVGKHLMSNYYYAEYLQHLVKLYDSCTQTLFYMTWGYKRGDLADYLSMQDNVTQSYLELAHTINAAASPVGEAWRYVILNHPTIDLHSSDLSHPNMAGSYLAACVFYTAIFKENPKGAWAPSGLSTDVVDILQDVAFKTVYNDLPRWNIDWQEKTCSSAPYAHNNHLWEEFNTQTNQPFEKLQFPTNKTGFAQCSFPHMLYATYDAGAHWAPLKTPNGVAYFDFHFVTDSIGFIITSSYVADSSTIDSVNNIDHVIYPRLYKTVNSGNSWKEIRLDTTQYRIPFRGLLYWTYIPNINIRFDHEDKGTILYLNPYSREDTMFSLRTKNGGLDWQFSKNNLPDLSAYPKMLSADTAYLSSYEPSNDTLKFWRTITGGESWTAYPDVTFHCCKSIQRVQYVQNVHQSKDGLIVTNHVNAPWIMRSSDINSQWDTLALLPFIGRMNAITEPADKLLYALVDNANVNRVVVSKDGGKHWELDSYHNIRLNALTHTSEYLYAGGYRGTLLRRKLTINRETPLPAYPLEGISIYPNPTDDIIYFGIPEDHQAHPAYATIYDVNGTKIDQIKFTTGTLAYSTAPLPAGIYFCQIVNALSKVPIGQGKFEVR